MCSLGPSAVPGRNHSVAAVIVDVLNFIFNSATLFKLIGLLVHSFIQSMLCKLLFITVLGSVIIEL